jgi:hypothetical protein
MIKQGTLVTWGSGKPRAIVLSSVVSCGEIRVRLVEDQVAPCGAKFEAGLEFSMPVDELREVPN